MPSPRNQSLMLDLSFQTQILDDNPYLESSSARLGDHVVEVYVLDDGHQKTLRVILDRELIYQTGDRMLPATWFSVCREGGYLARRDWDRDPAMILFQGVLPAIAEGWKEFKLPYEIGKLPEGMEALGTLQENHRSFFSRRALESKSELETQLVDMFRLLPLRAVVIQDRPERRVDYLGNAQDEPYVEVDLLLGSRPDATVCIGKVSLSSTGGMRWSPWLAGGTWANHGREFVSRTKAADFLKASGLKVPAGDGFEEAFSAMVESYSSFMDEPVARYLAAYPAAISWHHDPTSQYLQHAVVKAVQGQEGLVLTFDNGLTAVVPKEGNPALLPSPENGQFSL